MQVLINAVDKATKAGVYNLEEIALVMRSLEGLGKIVADDAAAKKEIEKAKKDDEKPLTDAQKKKLLKK